MKGVRPTTEVVCTAVNGGRKTETRVGLFMAAGGFIENIVVDFGDNDVVLEIE